MELFALSTVPSATPLAARLTAGYYASIACALWMYATARRVPPSAARAALSLPVILITVFATPLLIDNKSEAILVIPVAGIYHLMAFKVAAFAMGRGPLMLVQSSGFKHWAVVMCFPIIPAAVFKLSGGKADVQMANSPWDFLRSYGIKASANLLVAGLTQVPGVPILMVHWLYALSLSLFLGSLWDIWGAVASVMGVKVAPSFDKPWLSTTFADYWSRRWNLTVTYMLRVLIYEPVMEGRLIAEQPVCVHAPLPVGKAAAAAGRAAAEQASADSASDAGAGSDVSSTPDSGPEDMSSSRTGLKQRIVGAKRAEAPAGDEDTVSPIASTAAAVDSIGVQSVAAAATAPAAAPDSPSSKGTSAPTGAEAKAARTRKLVRRYMALQATFLFSGLWHMLLFRFAAGPWGWRWLAFFTLQGPIVLVETLLLGVAKRAGVRAPPRPVAIFLTNFLLIVIANPLFFGPVDDSGMTSRLFASVPGGFQSMLPTRWAAQLGGGGSL